MGCLGVVACLVIIIVFGPAALAIAGPALLWIVGIGVVIAIVWGAVALGIETLKQIGKALEAALGL